jgi:hypothetical protein
MGLESKPETKGSLDIVKINISTLMLQAIVIYEDMPPTSVIH